MLNAALWPARFSVKLTATLALSHAAFAEWRLPERDRLVVRYEFASRQWFAWFGYAEPFNDIR